MENRSAAVCAIINESSESSVPGDLAAAGDTADDEPSTANCSVGTTTNAAIGVAASVAVAATTRTRECSLASVVSAAAASNDANGGGGGGGGPTTNSYHHDANRTRIGYPVNDNNGAASQQLQQQQRSMTNKILSQNYNGTVVLTSSPNNEAELQLYRVMQRASLLAYYDTLLEMGGDDVQQLCDAGEEEFLEIMALVGMASKPLHVRRFQKALQEWITNPMMFQSPLLPTNSGSVYSLSRPLSVPNVSSSPITSTATFPNPQTITPASSPSSSMIQQLGEISSCTPAVTSAAASPVCSISPGPSPVSPLSMQHHMTPILDEAQIYRLEEAARLLVANLPDLEPKYQNAKKKVSKEVEAVLHLSEDDPQRMNQIRKYSAIYGRFDCKRRPEKPLTLHEVSVNEAAAQMCRYIPALLTRRDELFPLARQVVRDSGYHYSKGHSKSSAMNQYFRGSFNDLYTVEQLNSRKRWRSDSCVDSSEQSFNYKQSRLEQIAIEIQQVGDKFEELTKELAGCEENTSQYLSVKYQRDILQSKQNQLHLERASLQNSNDVKRSSEGKQRKYLLAGNNASFLDNERQDTDETDSQFSYSNAGSPYQDPMDCKDFINHDAEKSAASSNKSFVVVEQFVAVENKHGLNGQSGHSHKVGIKQDESSLEDDKDETMTSIRTMKKRNVAKLEMSENESEFGGYYNDHQLQVVASKGDNIIAVTNPALLTSSGGNKTTQHVTTTMKQERLSPVNSNAEE